MAGEREVELVVAVGAPAAACRETLGRHNFEQRPRLARRGTATTRRTLTLTKFGRKRVATKSTRPARVADAAAVALDAELGQTSKLALVPSVPIRWPWESTRRTTPAARASRWRGIQLQDRGCNLCRRPGSWKRCRGAGTVVARSGAEVAGAAPKKLRDLSVHVPQLHRGSPRDCAHNRLSARWHRGGSRPAAIRVWLSRRRRTGERPAIGSEPSGPVIQGWPSWSATLVGRGDAENVEQEPHCEREKPTRA